MQGQTGRVTQLSGPEHSDRAPLTCLLLLYRQVQNVHTGLDLTVPQHQEVRGKMMSGHVEYQILVVTRLAVFKSAKHRPEDVVQFLVSRGL